MAKKWYHTIYYLFILYLYAADFKGIFSISSSSTFRIFNFTFFFNQTYLVMQFYDIIQKRPNAQKNKMSKQYCLKLNRHKSKEYNLFTVFFLENIQNCYEIK